MRLRWLLIGGLVLASGIPVSGAEPNWIWQEGGAATEGYVMFRKSLFLREVPETASVTITVDDGYELYLNGTLAGKGNGWESMERYDVSDYLTAGKNVVGVRAENGGAEAGVVATLAWPGGSVVTDGSWKCKHTGRSIWGWEALDYDDRQWQAAKVLGVFGKTAPWGNRVAEAKETVKRRPDVRAGMRKLEDFELTAGDRVLFLGGTAVERSARYGYLETALQVSLGSTQVVFRNLGWSGDDVRGSSRGRFGFQPEGFRHLKQHVVDLKPTVIFVDYGRNEAFEGEEGLGDFQRGYAELLDVLESTGAKLVLTGPYQREALGGKLPDPAAYNRDLGRYVEVIRDTADRRGHWFLNLYEALEMRVSTRSQLSPLTYNGIHLTENGYRKLAEVVAEKLGSGVPNWAAVEGIRKVVMKKNEQFFHRWRPQNETYLTLFRKHEQGNNYREIPQFDPIIAEMEEEIAVKAAAYKQEVKP